MNNHKLLVGIPALIATLIGLAWAVMALVSKSTHPIPPGAVRWEVLDVSDTSAQADANLIQFGDGTRVLIDAGHRRSLFKLATQKYLRSRNSFLLMTGGVPQLAEQISMI